MAVGIAGAAFKAAFAVLPLFSGGSHTLLSSGMTPAAALLVVVRLEFGGVLAGILFLLPWLLPMYVIGLAVARLVRTSHCLFFTVLGLCMGVALPFAISAPHLPLAASENIARAALVRLGCIYTAAGAIGGTTCWAILRITRRST
ncbi:hypothetical protein K788_00003670 [Paraburkholderia caribensis MBA4]|uniref:Uncharacterized protein n=1 Tax=Paraburkholderia caribensis MBA4 TaxID=1323664 RepID=A0A0P0RHZ7_9BURK|nr:hypothetical protein K788_00003670 [Paraburkholderia caribensis MBA4]